MKKYRTLFLSAAISFGASSFAQTNLNDEYNYEPVNQNAELQKKSARDLEDVKKRIVINDADFIATIDQKKIWSHNFAFQYPDLKGKTTHEAAKIRKAILSDAILATILSVQNIPINHKKIDEELNANIQLPITEAQYQKIYANIEKLNILDQQGTSDDSEEESRVPAHIREIATTAHIFVPNFNDQIGKPKEEIIDDCVKNKKSRQTYYGILLLSVTEFAPKRDGNNLTIAAKIDFPELYKKYSLKPISDYLEK